MRVGIDARTLLGDRSGVGYYLSNLIEHGAFDGHEIFAYHASNKRYPDMTVPESTSFHWRRLSLPILGKKVLGLGWPLWWLNIQVTQALRRDNIDLFFGPNFVQPIAATQPSIVVVHDVIHRTYPDAHSKPYQWYLRASLAGVLRRADHVVTVSKKSRQDLLQFHPYLRGDVTVVYGAASDRYRQRDLSAETVATLREKYGLPRRFILYVGTIEPRKNLTAVVRALERIPASKRPPFVVVGEDRGHNEFSQAVRSSPVCDDINFTGYVQENHLPLLYNLAETFIYPSLYEGFGLPVLEAMQSGTPAIVSDRSSLPEVVGDAGKIVNPENGAELAEMIQLLWTNAGIRQQYVQRGMKRARRFSWDNSAKKIADLLARIS